MAAPDYDFLSLKLFACVVDLRNIAHAAQANNIAASAVSKRIVELETKANVALLYRRRDGVEPTSAGLALYRHICGLQNLLARVDAELSEYAGGTRGVIRICANTSAITEFLPEDIATFVNHYPEVHFELREDTSMRNIEDVANGFADIAIFSEHEAHGDLQTRHYRRDPLMIVAPRGHPILETASVKLADTLKYDQIGLHQGGSSLQAKVIAEVAALGVAARFRVRVLSFDAMRRMVEAGLGIAVLPKGTVMPYMDSMKIAAVALDEPWADRSLLLGYRDLSALPLVCRNFIDQIAPEK
ncbi:MAG: LysR family transcriptional regulator [Alphaproteobacteria bacterium]|nr:LysR family transcriptional regulator [Alphaproteobacteria bacterium]